MVGKIYMPDSDSSDNGTGRELFNAAHWDGMEWSYLKVMPDGGYVIPITCIYYFNENDIWFGEMSLPIKWNGEEFFEYHPGNSTHPGGQGTINAIWGTSSNNLFFIHRNGNILHYDGNEFTKMESGTNIHLLDIDGTPDGKHLFVRGYDGYVPSKDIVLEYDGTQWNTIYHIEGHYFPEENDYGHIEGIGVFEDTLYVTTVAGLWKYNFTNKNSVLIPHSISNMNQSAYPFVNIISINDIFFAGSGFHYIHFNGITFKHNQEITNMFVQRAMWGADYNGGLAVMVGMFDSFSHAMVAKGIQE